MNWNNVKLIFLREVRDQLRDRRTLFMIFVLPLLLYPLLGFSLLQVAQFTREQPTSVLILGATELPAEPALIDNYQFSDRLFGNPARARLIELTLGDALTDALSADSPESARQLARELVSRGDYEAVIYFPPDFAERLAQFQSALRRLAAGEQPADASETPTIPSPEIHYNAAKEKSQLAYFRVSQLLDRWTDEIGRQNLASSNLPESAARPFELSEFDLADKATVQAAMWAKILPFLLLIWALTGAFYPAVDLCAGEKERGTLETLLISPAERGEIVWGKLLTIMLFSVATAALNILCMGLTGILIIERVAQPALGAESLFGPPPPLAPLWLLLALVPMAALFSALCLALASMARSTKEGQYYLMPLLLVTMPLVLLPMAPGVELNLGNSLIPVTGVVLLLRSLLEGDYLAALPYAAPVTGVTLACVLFALRWAVDQFKSESVLFRESERWGLGMWLRHLLRDREPTPGAAAAAFCGVLILLIRFFVGLAAPPPTSFIELARLSLITQLVVVLTPAMLLTAIVARSPRKTLLLKWPKWWTLPAAVALAVTLYPAVTLLLSLIQTLYPISDEFKQGMAQLFGGEDVSLWLMLLVLALVPAICEELAFRGFILSGFRHLGHKWQAIVLTSVLFGVTHGILQQSLVATVLGLVLGFVAVHTGSIFPCMLYHLTHNGLNVLIAYLADAVRGQPSWLDWIAHVSESAEQPLTFHPWLIGAGGLAGVVLLLAFRRLRYEKTEEEVIEEAIEHHGMAS